MMLLFKKQGETHVVLTRRTDSVATHKGQISLPGGVVEPEDPSLLHTALRETQEELGIDPGQVQVMGRLGVVNTVVSNFDITPFVGQLAAPPSYRPDPAEVAEVIEVPLSALQDPTIFWEEERNGPHGKMKVYFFRYGEHIIWGATARILKQFLEQGLTPRTED